MKKINIALLTGGSSSEREISLLSAGNIRNVLDGSLYDVYLIDIYGRQWNCIHDDDNKTAVDKNDFSITLNSKHIIFDYALILIHGTPGEDGRIQGYLDMMGVSYSCCGVVSSVLTFDKVSCKRAVADAGVTVAREVFIRGGDIFDPAATVALLGLPVFVKPNASGSSFGVTKVKSADRIVAAVEEAFKESDAVIIEEFIDGREFGCGVMITAEGERVFPITEIVSKNDFFDYEAKYTAGMSDEITPADIPVDLAAEMGRLALIAYRACDCRGVVRVDFIVNKGKPYMIEINSVPGMSGASIVPKQAVAAGMTLGELFDIIIKDTYRPLKL